MTKKFEPINVESKVKEEIRFMANAQNKKMSVLIKEVFDLLFDQSNEFDPCVMISDGHSGKVVFAFAGKSDLVFAVGQSDEDVKKLAEDEFNKRKRDSENER